MQRGTDVHAKVSAMGGGRDIWKHSFHCRVNMAMGLEHGKELTLEGLQGRLPSYPSCQTDMEGQENLWHGRTKPAGWRDGQATRQTQTLWPSSVGFM